MDKRFEQHVERVKSGRYDLSPEEMNRRTGELLREREPASDDRFVCYMLDEQNERDTYFTDIARSIEREVFERRFPGNDTEGMQREYNPYENQSAFFVSIDTETGQPAGTIRIIRNGDGGFKTLEDLASPEYKDDPTYPDRVYSQYGITDADKCWDVATAAVRRGYGGGEVSAQVYRAMWVESQRESVEHFFSVINETPLELMNFLGFPFEKLYEADWIMDYAGTVPDSSEAESYTGSRRSLPVYGNAPIFEEEVRRAFDSIEEGEGKRSVEPFFRTLGYGDTDGSLQFLYERHEYDHIDRTDYAA